MISDITAQGVRRAAPPHEHTPAAPAVNVGTAERIGSVAVGACMAINGLKRGSLGGLAMAALGGALVYRGARGHCDLYTALGIDTAQSHPAIGVRAQHGFRVEKSIVINRPAAELYRFWRNVENLSRVMSHLRSVKAHDRRHSHWIAKGPVGTSVEWDAEIINERENELIAWRSLPGSQVDTAGSVRFEQVPQKQSTILQVSIKYDPPGGRVGASIAALLGEGLEHQLDHDLKQFKQMMESYETPSVSGTSSGSATI